MLAVYRGLHDFLITRESDRSQSICTDIDSACCPASYSEPIFDATNHDLLDKIVDPTGFLQALHCEALHRRMLTYNLSPMSGKDVEAISSPRREYV